MPPHLLGRGDHYALEVVGDSMCEAGIQDGDLVVIERADGADNGDIVVALIDDSEVTLKRMRCKGQTVALEAANPNTRRGSSARTGSRCRVVWSG